MPDRLWRAPVADLLAELKATPAGLTGDEAARRLEQYGPNEAATEKKRPGWLRLLSRLGNPLVIILLVASALSAAAGDVASFVIVVAIVLFSMLLDFVQENRAENAVEALRRSVAVDAAARRGGTRVSLAVDRLVPGDVIELVAGDLVPADCRLIESKDLFVNQALLTGEPYPVEKQASDGSEAGAGFAGAVNALFAGTSVISGTGTALVVGTGRATALGALASSLAAKPPATAFEIGVRRFGMLVLRIAVLMVLFVLVVNIAFQRPLLESLLFALALAVGLTPELLPMVLTVTLARSAIELAKRKVIVKRLAAIHDIGAMDMLCTDKTGTLTEARIDLVKCIDGFGAESATAFLYAAINSRCESGMKSPLDAAILKAHPPAAIQHWRKIDEAPFDFERRRVSILAERDGAAPDERRLIVKGAPEELLKLSTRVLTAEGGEQDLDDQARDRIARTFAELSTQGQRALGIASRVVPLDHLSASTKDETDLTFIGFAVFLDPPKESAGPIITALSQGGVAVKVLTGDNEQVARHVFGELGLAVTGCISGEELNHLGQDALLARLPEVNLFCRLNPQQKLRVLTGLKRLGHVVGYMGDGINDAPALHAADIGISVDGAADVARAAADLILLEHDLSVVRQAVLYGRRTVRNVAKYVLMGSSSNFGNMLSMALAAVLLPFLPMQPIQVLLNNLIYDLSQTALPFDEVDEEATARPAQWDNRLVARFMLVFGPLSSIFDLITFYALYVLLSAGETLFQTGWFVESLATQLLVVFAIRTRRPLFRSRPHALLLLAAFGLTALALALPFTPVGAWFGLVPLPPLFFAYLAAAVVAYLALVEWAKRWFYRRFAA
ncbi:MAG TPA: magnesium-translocating P-type ATPase [Dongiaceae bacterium]|nr:magnesium-translocating P-type ATPase [Dongiaceae bacterium]